MTVLSGRAPGAQAPAARQPAADDDAGRSTYVFAIHDAGAAASSACAGYDGGSAPYHLALADAEGGLWALAQDVPAAAFSDRSLRDRLADPASLEVFARTHHAVVTTAAAAGPVIPLPLATLFTDRRRAAETLAARAAEFHQILGRLRGRAEWAVKVYSTTGTARDNGVSVPRPGRTTPTSPTKPGAGRAYLDGVRAHRQDQEGKRAAALAEAAQVDEAIKSLAIGAVRRRPHGPQVTGRHRVQILNGAYLVDLHRAEDLRDLVDGLRVAGSIEIEVSGPWVPYSFAGAGCEAP